MKYLIFVYSQYFHENFGFPFRKLMAEEHKLINSLNSILNSKTGAKIVTNKIPHNTKVIHNHLLT